MREEAAECRARKGRGARGRGAGGSDHHELAHEKVVVLEAQLQRTGGGAGGGEVRGRSTHTANGSQRWE